MHLRPEMQLKTAIKAMTDVILPAVDPHDKPAQDQARLVIGMLSLLCDRLPLMYRYDRDELGRLLATADALDAQAQALPGSEQALRALDETRRRGQDTLSRAGAEPGELETMNFELRDRIGALVTTLYARNGTTTLRPISKLITANAQAQLLRERAWLVAQGWEAEPESLPAIETLIGGES